MKTCSICGCSSEHYMELKSQKILCTKCANRYPDSMIKKLNKIPFDVIRDMAYNHIRPYPRQKVTEYDIYGPLRLDITNGRLFISNSWIWTASIASSHFQFFPTDETNDMLYGRLALIISLRGISVRISQEIETIFIPKSGFIRGLFPWSHFSKHLEENIAANRDKFHFRHHQDKENKQKNEQKNRTSYNETYLDALKFFNLSGNYTIQQLRAARNRVQREVHPDNNCDNKNFANMEELSKLANHYFDILKDRLKKSI